MSKRFIIFGQPRSGSSTLVRVMGSHPQLKLIGEPFNKGRHTRKYQIKQYSLTKKGLKELWSECNGFKHLVGQGSLEANKRILSSAEVIIVLRRKNHLQGVLSHSISRQSKHWDTDRSVVKNHKYHKIDIKSFKADLKRREVSFVQYDKYIQDNQLSHLNIFYEIFIDHYQKASKWFKSYLSL